MINSCCKETAGRRQVLTKFKEIVTKFKHLNGGQAICVDYFPAGPGLKCFLTFFEIVSEPASNDIRTTRFGNDSCWFLTTTFLDK